MPTFIQHATIDARALAAEASAGLMARASAVAPKFFYDDLGSRLFAAITALPEYYVTRTEADVMAAHAGEMTAAIRQRLHDPLTMIDLGAGNCEKASRLFPVLRPSRYVAVDISTDFLHATLQTLERDNAGLQILGVGTDFSAKLDLPDEVIGAPSLVFYPGSSIGNFEPERALAFLGQIRRAAAGGALLIGVDLVKPAEVLEPAYADALGVTAAFNLNVLNHLNRLLGSDFELAHWRHVAFFDREASRIEMHLEATRETMVQWREGERRYEAGERILTEYSYKWTTERFAEMLRSAGFADVQTWTDERGWFAVMLAA
jgi:L-histidine Nalpha-methyltransferase